MKLFAISVCFLLFATVVSADPFTKPAPGLTPLVEVETDTPIKTAKYEDVLKYFDQRVKNLSSEEFYAKAKIIDAASGKEAKFSDLPDIHRNFFFLVQAEVVSNRLLDVQSKWEGQMARHVLARVESQLRNTPVIAPEKGYPTAEEVNVYIEKLIVIRKQHALAFEKLVDEVFEKYKAEIPEAEANRFKQQVKDWNKVQKLVNWPEEKKEAEKK